MVDIESWKSTPKKRKKHTIVMLLLLVAGLALWYMHSSTSNSDYRVGALYFSFMFLLQVPGYFLQHVVKATESKPLLWFQSPITYFIPLLLIVFWFMFK